MVFLPDVAAADGVERADDELAHELCSRAGAVVLCIPWAPRRPGALDRADAALVWAADHGGELGADPGRLVVVGRGAGAAAAAVLALRARDRGWPRIQRQVLVLADAGARPARYDAASTQDAIAPAHGSPAPAILVVPGVPHVRCSEWLRASGADVEELHCADASAASAQAGLAEPLLAGLVRLLHAALAVEDGR